MRHGFSTHPLYQIWRGMKDRCYNPNAPAFRFYGARGIVICAEWESDCTAFIKWALANGWDPDLELDRINCDGPYAPWNCRYVTSAENARNRRGVERITAFGETKIRYEWSKDPRCKCNYATLIRRLNAGWDAERAIATVAMPRSQRYKANGEMQQRKVIA